jgi:hypothetical protein
MPALNLCNAAASLPHERGKACNQGSNHEKQRFTADTLEPNAGEEFSSHKFSMGGDEDGWLLLRAF